MRTLQHISVLLLMATFVTACTGSKKMAKKGAKLDEAGLYAEAAGMYFESLRRNRNNIDAQIGLKTAGQRLLNDKLSGFFKSFSTGNEEDAVNAFLECEEYAARVKALGVILNIPSHYKEDFELVKNDYLLDLYVKGQGLMEEENYQEAERVFARIGELDPDFKDAGSLQNVAYLEPLYKSGMAAFEAKQFRKAYEEFDKVIARDASYKDVFEMREKAMVAGRYTIAVPSFENSAQNKDVTAKMSLYAMNELANINDPFIKVVDRDNIERILREQQLALSGVLDDQSVVEVGNLLGAQAALIGEVVHYQESRSSLQRTKKTGYTSYKAKVMNSETNEYEQVTKYRKTYYDEYKQSSSATITVNYKLISMETGEILMSKVVDETVNDAVHYAKFQGDMDKLFPSKDGKVDRGSRAKRELRSLLSADKTLRSLQDLRNDVLKQASSGMAYNVQSQVARIIP